MSERAGERDELRTTDEVVHETVLNFLRQRVDHHRRMADMMMEPFKSDHHELAEAFQAEARRLRDRGSDDLRSRVEKALRSWRSDYWTEGFDSERHSGLVDLLGDEEGSIRTGDREVDRLAAYVADELGRDRAASTDAPEEEAVRELTDIEPDHIGMDPETGEVGVAYTADAAPVRGEERDRECKRHDQYCHADPSHEGEHPTPRPTEPSPVQPESATQEDGDGGAAHQEGSDGD